MIKNLSRIEKDLKNFLFQNQESGMITIEIPSLPLTENTDLKNQNSLLGENQENLMSSDVKGKNDEQDQKSEQSQNMLKEFPYWKMEFKKNQTTEIFFTKSYLVLILYSEFTIFVWSNDTFRFEIH